MYVFGGLTRDGTTLDDLYAFKIGCTFLQIFKLRIARRWFSCQYSGGGPGPRYGHSISTCGTEILLLGGAPTSCFNNSYPKITHAYTLETTELINGESFQNVGDSRRSSVDTSLLVSEEVFVDSPTQGLPLRQREIVFLGFIGFLLLLFIFK
jgi:Galactose oxidase, central domain